MIILELIKFSSWGRLPGRRLNSHIWGRLPGRGTAIRFRRPLARLFASIVINYIAL